MSKALFFPQPEPLQYRYFDIEREYAEANPTLFGYMRQTVETNEDDFSEFVGIYRRTHPSLRVSTMMKEAKKAYEQLQLRKMMYDMSILQDK